MNKTRRSFLKTSGAAAVAPAIVSSSIFGNKARAAANERVNFGIIGTGGRGFSVMNSFLGEKDVQFVAVCDVDELHFGRDLKRNGQPRGREAAKLAVEQRYSKDTERNYKGCDAYNDFRELCARDDIDAVIVATPDHWHGLATLEALRNDKDVYCEKPVTHFFAEGQAVYRTAAEKKAIFQVGSQQRSSENFRLGVELVLNGAIGKVKEVIVGLPKGHNKPDGDPTITDPPEDQDYEMWTGPAKMMPYMNARNHWNWRWHTNYGGGQLMDWIGHHNDICHWGLGMDKSGPISVQAKGWTYPTETDVYDSPVDYEVVCEYDGGITTSIGSVNPMGTKWIGENGWVYVNRGKFEASNPEWTKKGYSAGDKTAYKSQGHSKNFLEGVKTRTECICPSETGHRSITPGHLAYVSESLGGEKLQWNPKKEKVVGNPDAQKKLSALPYRGDWSIEG